MDESLFDLVDTIYDCAIDPTRWPEALEQIAGHVHADCGALTIADPLKADVRLVQLWNNIPEFEAAMVRAAPINPFLTVSATPSHLLSAGS